MLKIKDNVDLKELEKFGFHKTKMYFNKKLVDVYDTEDGDLTIRCDNRRLICYNMVYNLLFDLIQAGLVEKVGEEK